MTASFPSCVRYASKLSGLNLTNYWHVSVGCCIIESTKVVHLVIILVLCVVREIHCNHFVLIVYSAIHSVMPLLLLQLPCTPRATFQGQMA